MVLWSQEFLKFCPWKVKRSGYYLKDVIDCLILLLVLNELRGLMVNKVFTMVLWSQEFLEFCPWKLKRSGYYLKDVIDCLILLLVLSKVKGEVVNTIFIAVSGPRSVVC